MTHVAYDTHGQKSGRMLECTIAITLHYSLSVFLFHKKLVLLLLRIAQHFTNREMTRQMKIFEISKNNFTILMGKFLCKLD